MIKFPIKYFFEINKSETTGRINVSAYVKRFFKSKKFDYSHSKFGFTTYDDASVFCHKMMDKVKDSYETLPMIFSRFKNYLKNNVFNFIDYFHKNPYTTYNKVKDHFKEPTKVWLFGFGRKRFPFYYSEFNWLFHYESNDVIYKDKWDSPRLEIEPQKYIALFGGLIWFGYKLFAPINDDDLSSKYTSSDDYWEQLIWTHDYCNDDLDKARSTWGWTDMENNSTWNDNFLK